MGYVGQGVGGYHGVQRHAESDAGSGDIEMFRFSQMALDVLFWVEKAYGLLETYAESQILLHTFVGGVGLPHAAAMLASLARPLRPWV